MQLCKIHNSYLLGVCINKQCQQPRECCLECIKKLHFSHIQEILDYKEIPQNFEELDQLQSILQKLLTNINNIFGDLMKRINVLKEQQNDLGKSIQLLVFLKAPEFDAFEKYFMQEENEFMVQCKKLLTQLEFTEKYPTLKQPIKLVQSNQSNISNSSCYLCKSNCLNNVKLSCTHKVCEKCLYSQQNCRLCQSQYTLNIGMKYIKQQGEVGIGISNYNPPIADESLKIVESKQQLQNIKSLQIQKQQNQLNDQFIKQEEQSKDINCSNITEKLYQHEDPQPAEDPEDPKNQSIVQKQIPMLQFSEEIQEVEQCILCKHKFALKDVFENSFCDHFYCFSCLDEINKKGKIKIICPVQNCKSYFDIEKFEKYYLNYQEMLLDTFKAIPLNLARVNE